MTRPLPIIYAGPAPIDIPAGLKQSTARPFFARAVGRRFEARQAGEVTEIELYDEIGFWGTTAADFRARLRGAGDVRLRINSPGGDVFDGIAMFNDLVEHTGRVEVEVTGLAASAASIIAMAGDRITIADNAFLMIHNAWTLALGDRHEIGHVSGVLGQIDAALARTYAARTGGKEADMAAMMDDETWMSGPDAVASGFADAIAELPEPQAAFDLSGFRNAPKDVPCAAAPGDVRPTTIRDAERALRDAGWSRPDAKAMAAKAFADPAAALWDAGDGDAEDLAALCGLNQALERMVQ